MTPDPVLSVDYSRKEGVSLPVDRACVVATVAGIVKCRVVWLLQPVACGNAEKDLVNREERGPFQDYYPPYRALYGLPCQIWGRVLPQAM